MGLLADFLSDDSGGRIWIEEATADNQAHDLIGAAVIGFRSTSLEEQPLGAVLAEIGEDLIITLASEVILLSGFGRAETLTFPFDEHGQAAADLVIVGDEESTSWSSKADLFFGERNLHGRKVRGESGM